MYLDMSLDYNVLKFKPTLSSNGLQHDEDRIDLLCRTWRNDMSPYPVNVMFVPGGYECRPDLLSLVIYGSDEYADLICKYNGISPFELNEGMMIFIPSVVWMDKSIATRETVACDLVDDDTSIRKKDYSIAKKKNEPRLGSDITIGDPPQYIIDKTTGLIIY